MSSIFNSLGSNYTFGQAFKHLFARGTSADYDQLVQELSERYDGEAYLFYRGREALRNALTLAGLKKDAAVAINGFSCYAVDEAVTNAGYTPAYLDIDKNQLHFTAKTLEKAIEDNPKIQAVINQNTLGYACDIAGIEAVCKEHDLVLIEDLAHSLGLVYPDGREAGTVGDFTMLSFGRDKVVDAVAGGALIAHKKVGEQWKKRLKRETHLPTRNQQRVDRLYPLSTWKVRVFFRIGLGKLLQIGFRKAGLLPRATDGNFNGFTDLPDHNAKEVRALLFRLKPANIRRRQIAAIYRDVLPKDIIPKIAQEPEGKPVELRFPILVNERDTLLYKLKQKGIHIADTWYDAPIAPPRFMKETSYDGQCSTSESTTKKLLNLPTHRNISPDQARELAERIADWLKQNHE